MRSVPLRISSGLLTAVLLLCAACGSLEITPSESLKVVHLPLDDAIDVDVQIRPQVYFSADVEPSSVTATSVLLESAQLTGDGHTADWACDSAWSPVAGSPGVDDQNPRAVTFVPDQTLTHSRRPDDRLAPP